MPHRVTLLPGDGIGPEVAEAAVKVMEAAGADITWETVEVGEKAVEKCGMPLPEEVFKSLRRTKVALKGPITTPIGRGYPSANVTLRKRLDLYANLRPIKTLPGILTRYDNVDLIVVRENTEDLYAGIEHQVTRGVVESVKIITWEACMRIAQFAFDFALRTGRKSITAVHKANIMKLSDGLFLRACEKVASRYPQIRYQECLVDALCMRLVMEPGDFDILLLENLYGDIVSDLCAGLVGGLGLVPGANLGKRAAIFETVHGSAPDIAGKGIANPTAMILSAEMLLRYIGENEAAQRIHNAVQGVLADRDRLTPDIGGRATTKEMTGAIIERLDGH